MTAEQLSLPGFEDTAQRTGWIYVGARGGQIKIGYTTRPKRRLAELQLAVLRLEPGTPADERALHARFRDARIDREWFLPSPALLSYACAA